VNNTGKPGIMDMDHILSNLPAPTHPWKAMTRGYHYNLYDRPFEAPSAENADWEVVRKNVGAMVAYSVKFLDLSKMTPNSALSSTQYALANPGIEYLVLQPGSGSFTLDLRAGTYDVEWFNPQTATTTARTSLNAVAGRNTFTPPFAGSAVLYLRLAGDPVSPTLPVTDLQFDVPVVAPGGTFIATFAGIDNGDFTYFDVTFRSPGNPTDQIVLNWQRGTRTAHVVPRETLPGTWTITGVRAHDNPLDHRGGFIPMSRSLVVTSPSGSSLSPPE
jgi:hypothetical protein